MDIETARATELRVLQPICEFTEHPDFTVFRSAKFPRYYAGNGIAWRASKGRTLRDFEQVFAEHFPPTRYEHRTFTFADLPEFEPVSRVAAAEDYHVTRDVFLFAERPAQGVSVPATLTVRKVDTEERWAKLRSFYDALSVGHDWYDGEKTSNELFEKTRYTSEAIGIDWYYLGPRDGDEIWSKLGIFTHAGICRLQEVGTHPDRRRAGLARALVNHAIELSTQRGRGVVVCAEDDYHAIDLYRDLGFKDVGASMQLMWYPKKS